MSVKILSVIVKCRFDHKLLIRFLHNIAAIRANKSDRKYSWSKRCSFWLDHSLPFCRGKKNFKKQCSASNTIIPCSFFCIHWIRNSLIMHQNKNSVWYTDVSLNGFVLAPSPFTLESIGDALLCLKGDFHDYDAQNLPTNRFFEIYQAVRQRSTFAKKQKEMGVTVLFSE